MRTESQMRYPVGTPLWVKMFDYYNQVARDAKSMGQSLKAKRFRNKAYKAAREAGVGVIDL